MQAFATLSNKLEPLVEGVLANKKHWLELASQNNKESNSDEDAEIETNSL